MAVLAGLAPVLSAVTAIGSLIAAFRKPKMPSLPPPVPPPRQPIRVSDTAAAQKATILTRIGGSGGGMKPAAIGAGAAASPAGPVTRTTLLGR